ncbi:phospholipase [Actinopolyspora mortivallis]|uniref:Phospholipase n=1 Tax=Actinopolyspora mortivallis TaxID=33906 RepID=A0A2T0GZ95_ACTMO|nr:phospholipase [Actinopolyspora mortivallis]PRW64424.1 hypothetical protein CEP50_05775 [Actinopolyspora mortivallis]
MSFGKRPHGRLRLTVLTTLCAALLGGTTTAQAATTGQDPRALTDHYLFEITLEEFVHVRSERPHRDELDWSSDACSYSPDEPLGYEFTASCQRHDFGYRNYKKQGRFTEQNRRAIDDNFRADMYSSCAGEALCERAADLYYLAVRQFGGQSRSTAEAVEKALSSAKDSVSD